MVICSLNQPYFLYQITQRSREIFEKMVKVGHLAMYASNTATTWRRYFLFIINGEVKVDLIHFSSFY